MLVVIRIVARLNGASATLRRKAEYILDQFVLFARVARGNQKCRPGRLNSKETESADAGGRCESRSTTSAHPCAPISADFRSRIVPAEMPATPV